MTRTTYISCEDNNFGDPGSNGGHGRRLDVPIEAECRKTVFELLRRFSGKKLHEWTEGVTVCSAHDRQLSHQDDGSLADLAAYSLHVDGDSARIDTHNCIGVLRIRDRETDQRVQLEIRSRFDKGNKQFFLNYLLEKVFGGSVVDEMIDAGTDSLWDMLLAFVFRKQLLDARRVGLFKQYEKLPYNNLRFRGKFNIDEHIRRNMPLGGAIAYTTNEITFDNPINHLIRHAFTKVNTKWPGVLAGDKCLTDMRHEIEQNTPTWQRGQVLDCIRGNLKPVRHPYFQASYEPLRKTALSILREEGASLYSSSQEVEGILFDGAWLWEKYIWTMLSQIGFEHTDNKTHSGWWEVLNETFYPDFFCIGPGQPRVVLDAKYKKEERKRDDIRQVLTYMYIMGAQHGGLIKPEGQTKQAETIRWVGDRDRWREDRGHWHDLSISIPSGCVTPADFKKAMATEEDRLVKRINETILAGVTEEAKRGRELV